MGWLEKLIGVLDLIKVENSIFVLPFTYIGMLFAPGLTFSKFVLVTVALVSARGAAFAANRYIGRVYDIKNPSKKKWSSVSLYSKGEILLIFLGLSAVFLVSAYMLNIFAFIFAPLILVLVILEPYTKQYTGHRHFSMALIIGLGILGGYIGVAGAFPPFPALYVLLLGYMFFSASNDIIISASHMEFDLRSGLKTYATRYGVKGALRYSYYAHGIAVVLFALFGYLSASWIIAAGAVATYPVLLLEHKNLERDAGAKNLNRSFFYYNAAVSLIMLASVLIFKFA